MTLSGPSTAARIQSRSTNSSPLIILLIKRSGEVFPTLHTLWSFFPFRQFCLVFPGNHLNQSNPIIFVSEKVYYYIISKMYGFNIVSLQYNKTNLPTLEYIYMGFLNLKSLKHKVAKIWELNLIKRGLPLLEPLHASFYHF